MAVGQYQVNDGASVPQAAPSAGMDWTSLLGAGASLYGQIGGYNTLNGAFQNAGITQLPSYSYAGPGGAGANLNTKNGTTSSSLGQLNPAYSALTGFGSGALGGLDPGLISRMLGPLGSQFNDATMGLRNAEAGNPQMSALGSGAFGVAGQQLQGLNDNYNTVYNRTLGNLRDNAAPQNLLAANQLQDSLFGTGNSNSTTGNNLATAFAKGLGQADSTYQLQAQQAGMQQQQNQLGLAQGAAGIGQNITGLSDTLLNNAFSRFGNTAQLLSGTQQQGLSSGLQATQGAQGLNQTALQNFQAALAAAQQQAAARNGSLSAYANLASATANKANPATSIGNTLSTLGKDGSSLYDLWNKFTGPSPAGGVAADALSSLSSSTAAAETGVGSQVAADNAAWLASQPAAAASGAPAASAIGSVAPAAAAAAAPAAAAVGASAASALGAGAPGVFASGGQAGGAAAAGGMGLGGALAGAGYLTIGSLLTGALMGGDHNVSIAPLANNKASGITVKQAPGPTGAFGSPTVNQYYNGKPINWGNNVTGNVNMAHAIQLFQSGNTQAYNQLMQSLTHG